MHRLFTLFIIFNYLSLNVTAQSEGNLFSQLLLEISNTPTESNQVLVDHFINQIGEAPLRESHKAHFFYKGNADTVAVAGDFTNWDPSNGIMTNIDATDLWYLTYEFDPAARLEYKIVINNKDWIQDPLNKLVDNNNSVLAMPKYQQASEKIVKSETPKGHRIKHLVTTKYFDFEREIEVYLPFGYDKSNMDHPVVLVNDGADYIEKGMDNILDNLIADNRISPIIAVYIKTENRTEEYWKTEQENYSQFVVNELIPWLHKNFRINKSAQQKIIMGSSLGANISIWIGLNYSDHIGNVAALSPYVENDIIIKFKDAKQLPLDFYILQGTYDHLVQIKVSTDIFIDNILEAQKYRYEYNEYPESHNYTFWSSYIDDALIYLLQR